MKHGLVLFAPLGVVTFFLAMVPGRAADDSTGESSFANNTPQLSPERLDVLDRRGYFTPGFKLAVHQLVMVRQTLKQTQAEEKQLQQSLPDLQKQSADTAAKVAALQQELLKYDHPDEIDFTALQERMKDPKAKTEEKLAYAQAFVWSYPASPHLMDAQQDLQQVQKAVADQQQSEKDAAAAKAAHWANLVQRAQTKDLKLSEWNEFLKDMTQEDVLKYLGRPPTMGQDYWLYSGAWTTDPYTGQKVGIEVGFNGARVNGVSVGPVAP